MIFIGAPRTYVELPVRVLPMRGGVTAPFPIAPIPCTARLSICLPVVVGLLFVWRVAYCLCVGDRSCAPRFVCVSTLAIVGHEPGYRWLRHPSARL